MRHIVVDVLIGVPHIAAIEHQRMIEQRAVAVRGLGQVVDEVGQHLHVILIDLRERLDNLRIFAVMRHAVETGSGRFTGRVSAAGEVAGKQQRAHARDVGLESQGEKMNCNLMCSSKVCGTPTGTLI